MTAPVIGSTKNSESVPAVSLKSGVLTSGSLPGLPFGVHGKNRNGVQFGVSTWPALNSSGCGEWYVTCVPFVRPWPSSVTVLPLTLETGKDFTKSDAVVWTDWVATRR